MHVLIPFQEGRYERVESLLSQNHSAVDARCHLTGDTPLIAAARNGHRKVRWPGYIHHSGTCCTYFVERNFVEGLIRIIRCFCGLHVAAIHRQNKQ